MLIPAQVLVPSVRTDVLTSPAAGLKSLAPGQKLDALLVGMDTAGMAELRLTDGTGLRASLATALPPGSRLQLLVETNGRNAATLRLLGVEPPVASSPAPATAAAGRTQQILPLPELASRASDVAGDRPPLADARSMSSAALAYADAGRELSGPQQQPVSHAADEVTLRFAIAFAGEQRLIDVQVEPDPEGEGVEARERDGWQLRFAMDFSETGPSEARLRFGAGRLDLTLWAERPELAAALRASLDALRGELAEAGINAGTLFVADGRPGASLGGRGRIVGE